MRGLSTLAFVSLLSLASLAASPPAPRPQEGDPAPALRVRIETNLGDMTFALDAGKAPRTTANFLRYAQDGFYESTIFHRVLATFMAQGGGLTADGQKKETRAPIRNEADNGLQNLAGTIAMARTNEPHSATSQFFINLADNAFLDHPGQTGWGYCVFGRLVEGQPVLEAIRSAPVRLDPRFGREEAAPVEPIVIEKVTILDAEACSQALTAAANLPAPKPDPSPQERDAAQLQAALALVAAKGIDTSEITTSGSGLSWIDVAEGSGASPAASDLVAVHFTLWTAADGRKIDASADHPGGGPYRTRLDQVIAGWTEGITGMKVGGERWLVIPPRLGYGEGAHPAGIPGGATLVFHMKLEGIGET